MTLARKYEAATLRALYKALNEFREAEDMEFASVDVVESPEQEETCGELGSIGSEAEPEPEGSEPEAEPVETPGPTSDPGPSQPAGRVVRTPEERKKRPNPAKSRRPLTASSLLGGPVSEASPEGPGSRSVPA